MIKDGEDDVGLSLADAIPVCSMTKFSGCNGGVWLATTLFFVNM